MTLDELKRRLQIPDEDTSKDEYLQDVLEEAIEWVQCVCNQDFLVDGELKLPSVAKSVIAQYVNFEMQNNAGIKSESIGGMSQTFDSVEERNQALISKLSSAGLRKLRFKPLGA
ncbi:phage head-tail connector protein [Ureibacillus suwonensis]|uniref:Phage head-tail connector protein n=1 Tax=Ureibacillus suwonensis TaxID=313007 RepID=A0ABW0RAX4_9BACL